ncbi:DAK2 domain-containing protein [Brevibacillus fluminis]|uniref:DAK2 domain-containing protein n=1 Tax=Brevibacillus fluminis TaxID=511487 RepID=A0A3M8DTI6_9BACL|nr:DAK2 domain-containing protein [Brevibacillus fluminis]RNB91234.1 DAK2 domain-containing protein [Brevibacillus fluminis]
MVHTQLDGDLFSQMVFLGAAKLRTNVKMVDALNVFPVPDGDTGTNMNMTFTTGVEELAKRQSPHLSESAQTLAKGLLMGARGNSGVILSQLFRGFSKSVSGKSEITAHQFADALKAGVDTAYQAVMRPVEGTILTVAREAAETAVRAARVSDNLTAVMEKTLEQAKLTLSRTPEYLPVLKEVGVVDSGGQGLVLIYEGFVQALHGEVVDDADHGQQVASVAELEQLVAEQHNAQLHMKTEDITFGYCTEFMIRLADSTEANKKAFAEQLFRAQLDRMGDSLLVVSDEEVVKVHIHAEHPGEVLNYAQQYGSLHRLKIENMREQHSNIVKEEATKHDSAVPVPVAAEVHTAEVAAPQAESKRLPYGIIAVAAGPGIAEIFKSLGVHAVVEGGQTMNPSTEDFVNAMNGLDAERIIILPNNSNIVMAAQQSAALVDVPVAVIPTKSVPQGMTALVSFNGDESLDTNQEAMTAAIAQVKTGLVTHSVRDTKLGDVEIKEGDFIGIADGTIVTAQADMMEAAKELLRNMVDEDTGIVSILLGEGTQDEQGEALVAQLADDHPDVEAEVAYGGQPLYPFIFAVE